MIQAQAILCEVSGANSAVDAVFAPVALVKVAAVAVAAGDALPYRQDVAAHVQELRSVL